MLGPSHQRTLKKNEGDPRNPFGGGLKRCSTHRGATAKPRLSHGRPAFGPRIAPGSGRGQVVILLYYYIEEQCCDLAR